MLNFQTNNLVIACYKQGAGGKFLLNSIGLSKHAVLQDAKLATAQMNGTLSPMQKQNLLLGRLEEINVSWSDLNLGCHQLFETMSSDYFTKFTEVPQTFVFGDAVKNLSNSNLKFGLVAHLHTLLVRQLQVWPNATVIFFKNQEKFIETFRTEFTRPLWPLESERQQLAQEQESLIEKNISSTNQCLTWDCNWFYDEQLTLSNIKNIYYSLEMDDFDESLISAYYRKWIEKMRNSPPREPGSEYEKRIRWNI